MSDAPVDFDENCFKYLLCCDVYIARKIIKMDGRTPMTLRKILSAVRRFIVFDGTSNGGMFNLTFLNKMKSFIEFIREVNAEEKYIDFLLEKGVLRNTIKI